MLQDRIVKISDYFKGIRVDGGLYIINVEYKNGWKAFGSSDGKIKAAQNENNLNEWFYYTKMSDSNIDEIFDLIDETIEFNENIRKKIELLKSKVEELKALFDTESLDRLETLEFVFNEPKKKKKNKKTELSIEQTENVKITDNNEVEQC